MTRETARWRSGNESLITRTRAELRRLGSAAQHADHLRSLPATQTAAPNRRQITVVRSIQALGLSGLDADRNPGQLGSPEFIGQSLSPVTVPTLTLPGRFLAESVQLGPSII